MKKTIAIMLTALSFGMMAQTTGKPDEKFAMDAAKAGAKEIKLGQMAVSKGSTPEVRQLGQMMVDEHTKAAAALQALADRKGIKLPSAEADAECKKCCEDLSKKTGKEFDKAYTELMVKDHKKVIAMFKTEKDSGKDADLKSWAASTLPTLEHHLQMSEDACKSNKM